VVFDVVTNNLTELKDKVWLSKRLGDGVIKASKTCDVDVLHAG
jgi:hypothetical protein